MHFLVGAVARCHKQARQKRKRGTQGTVTTVLVVLNCHGCRRGRHRRQAAEWFGLFVASWDSLGLGEILH